MYIWKVMTLLIRERLGATLISWAIIRADEINRANKVYSTAQNSSHDHIQKLIQHRSTKGVMGVTPSWCDLGRRSRIDGSIHQSQFCFTKIRQKNQQYLRIYIAVTLSRVVEIYRLRSVVKPGRFAIRRPQLGLQVHSYNWLAWVILGDSWSGLSSPSPSLTGTLAGVGSGCAAVTVPAAWPFCGSAAQRSHSWA